MVDPEAPPPGMFDIRRSIVNWTWKRWGCIAAAAVVALLAGITVGLAAIIEAEVQSRWPGAKTFLGTLPWGWMLGALVVGILLVGLPLLWLLGQRQEAHKSQLADFEHERREEVKYLEQVREVDSALFPLLSALSTNTAEPALALERLLRQYLQQLRDVMYPDGSTVREAIFVPSADRKWLVPLVAVPAGSDGQGSRVRCRINCKGGKPSKDCSSASAAFLTKKTRVAHLDRQDDGRWLSDDEHWYYVGYGKPEYLSVASVPVVSSSNTCLGVITIAGSTRDLFDADVVKRALADMAIRACCALTVYHALFPDTPLVAPAGPPLRDGVATHVHPVAPPESE